MKQSSKRISSILLSAVFIIGSIIVFTTFIRPELDRVTEIRNLIFSKEELVANQSQAVNTVEQMIESVRGNEQLRGVLQMAIPRERRETNIINQINAIAQNAEVQIRTIDMELAEPVASNRPLVRLMGVIDVELEVSGQYRDVADLVRMLEANVRVFKIKEAELSSSIDEEQELFLEGVLNFEAYFQRSEESLEEGN